MTPPVRFAFRLQRVLELRERHEEAAQARLAAEAAGATAARVVVEQLAAIRAAGTEALSAAHAAPTSVAHLRAFAFAAEQMDAHLDVASQAAAVAEERVSEAQGALLEAFRARNAITRLRERAHDTWRVETALAEQRAMDELALSRFVRSNAMAVGE